jgi:AbrB family looped-hinge helix DNA binding protein
MDLVTVSSKGQIAIPKKVRDALNLSEGTKLNVEVRGQKIVLSKEPAWKRLAGAGAGLGLIEFYAAQKKRERELEDSRS